MPATVYAPYDAGKTTEMAFFTSAGQWLITAPGAGQGTLEPYNGANYTPKYKLAGVEIPARQLYSFTLPTIVALPVRLQFIGYDSSSGDRIAAGMLSLDANGNEVYPVEPMTAERPILIDNVGFVSANVNQQALIDIGAAIQALNIVCVNIQDGIYSDRYQDMNQTPNQEVWIKQHSGALGDVAAVVLLKRDLRDRNGAPVTDLTTPVRTAIEP
jgi:hypothetical protein